MPLQNSRNFADKYDGPQRAGLPRIGGSTSTRMRGGIITVPLLDNLFGPQSRNLESALSRTSDRHALLTNNLANVNVPGYKRKDIDFGIVLEGEEGKAGNRIASLKAKLGQGGSTGAIRVDGSSVDLENEVMSISESELRYQMLTEITSRYFGNMKNVIREGK